MSKRRDLFTPCTVICRLVDFRTSFSLWLAIAQSIISDQFVVIFLAIHRRLFSFSISHAQKLVNVNMKSCFPTHAHTYEKQRLESRMTFDQFFHWCSSGGRWIRRIRYIPWITMNNNTRSSSFFENHSKALSKFRQWQCSIWCHEKCSLKKIMIIDVHLFTVPTLKNIIGRLS